MSKAIKTTENKIKELENRIEIVRKELSKIKAEKIEIRGEKTFEKFERRLHKKYIELSDLEAAKKLQEILYHEELNKEAKELAKSHPKKNEG